MLTISYSEEAKDNSKVKVTVGLQAHASFEKMLSSFLHSSKL
jgi:hypothetical protein